MKCSEEIIYSNYDDYKSKDIQENSAPGDLSSGKYLISKNTLSTQ